MIDEKGRLFGKINLIDLLVILVVVVVVGVLAVRLLWPAEPDEVVQTGQAGRLEFVVKVSRMDPVAYEHIEAQLAEGQNQFMASGVMVDGYVTDVYSTPNPVQYDTQDGEWVMAEDNYYVDVYFTIEAAVSNTITQAVGTQEVRIGRAYIVKTTGFEYTGIVVDCALMDSAA